MKIAMIGPVHPYKGGIAHYTDLLCRALREDGNEVQLYTFKFQYPKLLYKKPQKDMKSSGFGTNDADFCIHTLNPFNWIKVAGRIKKQKPELIILQWWHPYFAPCFWSICKLLRREKILFVCHNVFPHERFPLDRLLTKWTLGCGRYFITQSKMDARDLLSVKHDAVYRVTPHPTYGMFCRQGMSMQKAREQLQIDQGQRVLLFFGFVRKYKGLQYLLEAMKLLKERDFKVQLWVVGDFGEDKEEYVEQIRAFEIGDQVQMVEGYVPDDEVEKYFAASDLVVLPYLSATQSGIVQIAFGFEKPVLVTEVGGLPDVVTNGKTGYVVEPRSAEMIAEAIMDYYINNRREAFVSQIEKEKDRFSWKTFVDTLMEMVRRD
ncbi:putative uncharacterized protein [Firmicutes bacterium CAG:534]|mgnify:FL=1|nr:putative uncharacterized protein [Firmicutes bacterium CAG:534]